MSIQPKYPITLQLDSDAVEVFKMISDTDKEKLEILVSSLFKEYKKSSIETLKQTMDEISQKAQERGLTPEILEEILSEEE
jgi:DNA-binding protein YbaB